MHGGKDRGNRGQFSHNLSPVATAVKLRLRFSLCSHNLQSGPLQLGSQNRLQTAPVSQNRLSMLFLPVKAPNISLINKISIAHTIPDLSSLHNKIKTRHKIEDSNKTLISTDAVLVPKNLYIYVPKITLHHIFKCLK